MPLSHLCHAFSPESRGWWDCLLGRFCTKWRAVRPGWGGWAWPDPLGNSWGCRSLPASSPLCPSHGKRSRAATRCGAAWGTGLARNSASKRRRRSPRGQTLTQWWHVDKVHYLTIPIWKKIKKTSYILRDFHSEGCNCILFSIFLPRFMR